MLGHVDELREIALRHGVREVFVALPSLSHTRMLSLVLECEDLGIAFRCVTNLFEVLTAGTPLDLVDDLPLVRLGRERTDPLYAPIKRAFDLLGAALGLLRGRAAAARVRLADLRREGARSAALRADAHRPARPALPHVEAAHAARGRGPLHRGAARSGDDPRITRFGRWLRAHEPRRAAAALERAARRDVAGRPAPRDALHRRRATTTGSAGASTVKPGITGLWQILGRKDLPMHENLQYDFYYIRNRSLALDLSILLRTVGAVLSRRGAF